MQLGVMHSLQPAWRNRLLHNPMMYLTTGYTLFVAVMEVKEPK